MEVSQEFRWIMKLKICILYIFITSLSVSGQQIKSCNLKISDSPKLRGFFLGMSGTEIIRKFSKAEIPKSNNLGYSKIQFSFFPLPDRYTSYGEDTATNSVDTTKSTKYKGWQTATFELIDDKVVSIEIQYDSAIKWKNLLAFIEQVSEPMKLPKSWESDSTSASKYSQENYLNCDGFRVESRMTGQTNPIIYFVDLESPKIYKQRKAALENQKLKEFKPE